MPYTVNGIEYGFVQYSRMIMMKCHRILKAM